MIKCARLSSVYGYLLVMRVVNPRRSLMSAKMVFHLEAEDVVGGDRNFESIIPVNHCGAWKWSMKHFIVYVQCKRMVGGFKGCCYEILDEHDRFVLLDLKFQKVSWDISNVTELFWLEYLKHMHWIISVGRISYGNRCNNAFLGVSLGAHSLRY